jgi:predicted anti-sigma-YlaC factor YlaD
MELTRRTTLAGLAVMGGVGLATAIWPHVAAGVLGVLVAMLSTVTAVLTVVVVRWVCGELAWRRELRAMPPVDVAACGTAPAAPWLAELRPSA